MVEYQALHLPSQPTSKVLLVRTFYKLWVFVDAGTQLNPWMVLHRESNSDLDLEGLLHTRASGRYLSSHVAWHIASHFELVAGSSQPNDFEDIEIVKNAVKIGQLKASKFDNTSSNYQKLADTNGFYWSSHKDWLSASTSQRGLENKLIIELGAILSTRWRLATKSNLALSQQSAFTQQILKIYAGLQGRDDAIASLRESIMNIGYVLVERVGTLCKLTTHYSLEVLEGKYVTIAQELRQAGLDAIQSGSEMKKAAQKGLSMLRVLLGNHRTREVIFCFLDGYTESMSELGKVRAGANGAIQVGIDVQLALGSFGLGAEIEGTALAAKVASAANSASEFIGPFTVRALKLMVALYRLLDRPAEIAVEAGVGKVVGTIRGFERAEKEAKAAIVSTRREALQVSDEVSSASSNASKKIQSEAEKASTKVEEKVIKKQEANATRAADTCKEGEPINPFNGQEILQLTDFVMEGAVPLVWQRTYRSGALNNSGMGHGWASPITPQLFARKLGEVEQMVWVDVEGREVYFDWPSHLANDSTDGGGFESTNASEQLRLCQTSTGFSIKPLHGLGLCEHYERCATSNRWRRSHIRDSFGNWLAFEYASANAIYPHRIHNNEGKALRLSYTPEGELESVDYHQSGELELDSTQRLASYAYDNDRNLILAADALGQAEHYTYQHHVFATRTLKTGYTFHFEWEGQGESARCVHQWGDPVNGQTTYEYRFKYFPAQRTTVVTDTRGAQTRYEFNEQGLPIAITDGEGGRTRYAYNEQGKLITQTDPAGCKQTFEYDEQGQLAASTNPLGQRFQLSRNAQGVVTTISNPLGQTQSRVVNEQGQTAEQNGHRYTYSEEGLIQSHTDPMGRTTRFVWNHLGQLVATRAPNGLHTRYQYQPHGPMNLLSSVTAPDALGKESTTRYQYDALGQCTAVTNAQGKTTRYQYNAQGLVTEIENDHQKLIYTYQGLSQVSSKTLYQAVAPQANAGTSRWQKVSELHYQYDGERNLVALTNEKGERYQFSYDQAERLVQEVGFDGRTRQYQYNPAGHLQASLEIDATLPPEQQVLARTQYTRNALGQLTELAAFDHTQGQPTQSHTQFEYDALGRLTLASNPHRTLNWRYNEQGQLIEETQGDVLLRHAYNAVGQRTQTEIVHGDAKLSEEANHAAEVITYTYDESPTGLGLFNGMAYNGQNILHLAHNEQGLETQRLHGNQLNTQSHYDPQGRLLAQRTLKGTQAAQAILERRYQYDALGRINQIDDQLRGSTHYFYDPLSRLKAVQGPVPEQFIFDPASNLLGMESAIGTEQNETPKATGSTLATPNPQQVRGNRLAFQGDQHYRYDLLGRRIEKRWGKGQRFKQSYRYNAQSQLVQTQTNGVQTRYAYDPLGRRILKASEEHQTTFYWLGDSLLKEQSESLSQGKHSTTYLFEPEQGNGESFKPVAVVKTQGPHSTEGNERNGANQRAQIYHIHTDHLGTPQEVTDREGNIVWAPQFKAYGRVHKKHLSLVSGNNALKPVEAFEESPDQDFELNLRFQGQYHDAETGLHYNRHRYYDPDCGQFISQDPIGLLGGLNNYQYVTNPVGWVDPLGLCEIYQFNMVENPGPLASLRGTPAANFAGGKYNQRVLEEDTIFFRGGASGGGKNALGQWFNTSPPESIAKVRIDNAVKPQWIDVNSLELKATSPVDAVYAIKIPKGTTVYEGPVGYQGGPYLGGQNIMQTFIEAPWNVRGVQVLSESPLK